MKLLSSPAFLAILAFLLSIGSISSLVFLKKDELWPAKRVEAPRFPSVEFDPDASSYSPAETHAMDQLYKELDAAREAILKKEDELRDRERILDSARNDLERAKSDLNDRQRQLEDEIVGYMASFEKVSESEEKNLKKLAATLVELSAAGSVELIKQYDKDQKVDQIVKVLEYLKPGEIAPIFDEMMKDDDDASTKLVETITERLRTLYREPTAGAN